MNNDQIMRHLPRFIWRNLRKVCNVGEDVQRGRDSKSKRPSNLEGTHRIPDIIQDVVRILPSIISIKDFEHRG